MSPEVVVIGLGGADLPLAKQYYTKPAVLANYTKEIAEMYQVLASEKPIDDAPIPASTNASLYAKATRIVDFETKLSNITADPDLQSKIEVCHEGAKRCASNWLYSTTILFVL